MSSDLSSDLTSDLSVIVSIPATQDPRSKISRKLFILSFLRHEFRLEFRLDFRLECHSLDSCYPRSKIQDFQKAFLGNLGINPRSKIQEFQKTFLGCTCRILDAPKILDLGFIPRFPRFPRKVFLDAGLEILDLGCKIQDFQNLGTFLASKKRILDESWILDLGFIPRFPRCIQEKFSGNLGSWILGASKILQVHPRKVFWNSWILDLGFIPRFPRKAFWKSWILDLG